VRSHRGELAFLDREQRFWTRQKDNERAILAGKRNSPRKQE
jgi:hypothetical protein